PHASVGFYPYAEIQKVAADSPDRAIDLAKMAPVHARVKGRTVGRMGKHQAKRVHEKTAERVFGEFPRGHRKLAMLLRPFAAHVPVHRDIVRGVGENRGGLLASEEYAIGVRI